MSKLVQDILAYSKEENYEGILESTNNVNQKTFDEYPDILRCRLISMIKLDKFDQVSKYLEKKNSVEFCLEKAYALYKQNKLNDSLAVIDSFVDSLPLKSSLKVDLLQLKAQVCYRSEQFNESLDIYKSLATGEDQDVQTNILAVQGVKMACSGIHSTTENPASYPGLFNLAYYHISKGDSLKEALDILQQATELCKSQMEQEGYDQDDIDKELLVIESQRAYVLQMLGQTAEAQQVYQKVLCAKNLDPVILAIATNNLQVVKGAQDVLEVSKALKFINTPSIIAKLNTSQTFLVEFNALIYSLLVGKNSVAWSKLNALKEKLRPDDKRAELLEYVELGFSLKQKKITFKDLLAFASANPKSIAAQIFVLDHHLQSSNWAAFEQLLSRLTTDNSFDAFRPGLLSLLVWVSGKNGKHAQALKALEAGYSIKGSSHQQTMQQILQLSDFKLKLGNFKEAKQEFEKLFRLYPEQRDDADVSASYLLCLANIDEQDAYAEMVHVLDTIQENYTFDILDDTSALQILPSTTRKNNEPQKKKKRKAKPVPKTFDANREPDSERWLPKRQRTAAKAKALKQLQKDSKVSGIGFQGVALSGGALGSTGSARIAGLAVKPSQAPPVDESQVKKEEPKVTPNFPPPKSKKKGGKKK